VPHEQFGSFPMQNVFPKLSATPGTVRWPGPELGEHTDQVLTERLGYSAAQIRQLRADAVI
jgi:formyl-CoA transferase